MTKPSAADLKAYHQSRPSLPSNTINEFGTFPPPKPKMSLQARTPITRRGDDSEEDDDEDDELFGVKKNRKPKESLMDLLNSDPPWMTSNPEPSPSPPSPIVPRKKSFGTRLLRPKTNPAPKPALAGDDASFRRPGALRTSNSVNSLKTNGNKLTKSKNGFGGRDQDDDEFARHLAPQTRKLSAKAAQTVSSSTRELADFLRSSEPPASPYPSSQDSRSRAASTGSLETFNTSGTQTTSSRIRHAFSRATSATKLPQEENRAPATMTSETWAKSRGDTEVTMFESVSPAAAVARVHSSAPPSTTLNTSNLTRSSSLSNVSPSRRSVRKPAPQPSPELLEEEEAQASNPNRMSSMPYLSESTLAMILGEDLPSEVLSSSTPAPSSANPAPRNSFQHPRSLSTPVGAAERKEKEAVVSDILRRPSYSKSNGSIVSATSTAVKDSTTQTTPPKETAPSITSSTISTLPSFKFSRRPATADSTLPSHPAPLHNPRTSPRSGIFTHKSAALSPPVYLTGRSRRPTSPPPEGPLPLPPPNGRRARPLSSTFQNSIRSSVGSFHSLSSNFATRNPSVDSLLDPPLTATRDGDDASGSDNGDTKYDDDDVIFVALRALQKSMHLAAGLRIDYRPFKVAKEEKKEIKTDKVVEVTSINGIVDSEADTTKADDLEQPPEVEEDVRKEPEGLKRAEMNALLPALVALQSQMANAATLLDLVIKRATLREGKIEEEEAAKAADVLLNGDSGVGLSDDSSQGAEEGEDGGGEGEEKAEDLIVENDDEAKEEVLNVVDDGAQQRSIDHSNSSDDDAFPLLVKHLSISSRAPIL